jgi:hypothetical protein
MVGNVGKTNNTEQSELSQGRRIPSNDSRDPKVLACDEPSVGDEPTIYMQPLETLYLTQWL